jgi:hypothetical protein
LPPELKIFRVLVTGVSRGKRMSVRDLCEAVARSYPLPEDARISLELGRSAVVAEATSEAQARRTATALVKLGAEVRIEPDPAGVGAGAAAPADAFSFGEVDLGEAPEGRGLELEVAAPARPAAARERPGADPGPVRDGVTLVDRPPSRDAAPRARPPAHASGSAPFPVLDTPMPVAVTAPPEPSASPPSPASPVSDGSEPDEPPSAARPRAALVRCSVHGLLYDANQSEGCRRCLGATAEPRPTGLKGHLAARPHLRWAVGLAIGLALGAVPAGFVASARKQGAILEKRVEAESIRVGRTPSADPVREHRAARQAIAAARTKGVALSAILWIGTLAIFLLVWLKLF